jgi:hypothetical protein
MDRLRVPGSTSVQDSFWYGGRLRPWAVSWAAWLAARGEPGATALAAALRAADVEAVLALPAQFWFEQWRASGAGVDRRRPAPAPAVRPVRAPGPVSAAVSKARRWLVRRRSR